MFHVIRRLSFSLFQRLTGVASTTCPAVGNVWLTGCDHRLRSGGTYGDIAAAGCCATVCEDVANHVTTVAQHFNYSGCISVLLY